MTRNARLIALSAAAILAGAYFQSAPAFAEGGSSGKSGSAFCNPYGPVADPRPLQTCR